MLLNTADPQADAGRGHGNPVNQQWQDHGNRVRPRGDHKLPLRIAWLELAPVDRLAQLFDRRADRPPDFQRAGRRDQSAAAPFEKGIIQRRPEPGLPPKKWSGI